MPIEQGQWNSIFPSLTNVTGFLIKRSVRLKSNLKNSYYPLVLAPEILRQAFLFKTMSKCISRGGKPSWCCSWKMDQNLFSHQQFFPGQWMNQNVRTYSSLTPWEKQILKKKVFKLCFPLLLPSKWKDLRLVYLPLKQFKWLPQTGLIYKSRLHSICL